MIFTHHHTRSLKNISNMEDKMNKSQKTQKTFSFDFDVTVKKRFRRMSISALTEEEALLKAKRIIQDSIDGDIVSFGEKRITRRKTTQPVVLLGGAV